MNSSTFKKRLAYVLAAGLTLGAVTPVVTQDIYAATVSQSVLTVTEALAESTASGYVDSQQSVAGYIIGYGNSGELALGTEGATDAVIVIADSLSETSLKNAMVISLNTTALKNDWGLATNPDFLGEKIVISGINESYYGTRGIKSPTAIRFEDNKVRYKIKATPGAGNVEAGTTIKLETTTDSAIVYKTDLDDTYRNYDASAGITVDQSMTITAKFENEEVSTKEFSFAYNVVNLENLTIQQVREGSLGAVTFKGIVTRLIENGKYTTCYVQDATGGMYIYSITSKEDIQEGDEVVVQGELIVYKDLLEVKNATIKHVDVPTLEQVTPQTITIAEYNANPDAYESELILFEDVTLGAVNYTGSTTIQDSTGKAVVYKMIEGIEEGYDLYDIIAIGSRYGSTRQLSVVDTKDVVAKEGMQKLQDIILKEGETLTLQDKVLVITNGQRDEVEVVWNQDDLAAFNKDIAGQYNLRYTVNGKEFAISVSVVSKNGIKISDIQGESHTSPFLGQKVADIQGVITALDGKYGFYMQDMNPDNNDATSDAIYVDAYNHGLSVGTLVSVSGTVGEEFGYTTNPNTDKSVQLTNTEIKSSNVKVLETGKEIPEAITIGTDGRMPSVKDIIDNDNFKVFDPEEDFIDFYESLEGMLVQINDAQVVGGNKYEEIPVVPDRGAHSSNGLSSLGGVTVSENTMHPEIISLMKGMNTKLPTVMIGDVFKGSVVGVLTYNDGNYKVAIKDALPSIEEHTYDADRTTTLTETEDGLRIASFNVENMGGNAAQSKVDAIAKVITEKMDSPEIIGLQEVQDNTGDTDNGETSADVIYTRLIEALKAANPEVEYAYTEIAPENNEDGGAPGGNIRVGFLYRTDRVELVKREAGDSTTKVEVIKNEDGSAGLSLNPGRIDPNNSSFIETRKSLATEFIFNGERVIVINNHLSSKGGDTPLFGNVQPADLVSEKERIEQAKIVNNFVEEILAVDKDAKVVVLGDMNDYYFSAPLKALEGDALYNMHYELPEAERFTYSYQGKSQVLDNILVTKDLVEASEIDILHINSSRAKGVQISDHDPVIVRINMDDVKKPVVTPDDDEEDDYTPPSTGSGSGTSNNTDNKEEVKEEIKEENKTEAPVNTFKDIKANHWAQKDIMTLAEKGILIGVGNGEFAPNKGMKAADTKTLLSRIYDGKIEMGNLKDGELLTRAQLAVILKNTFGKNVQTTASLAQFKDLKALGQEEMEALSYVYEMGILKGVSDNQMSPNTKVTRAQVATIIVRLLAVLEK